MHIDHSKLVELLTETSGIDKAKIEAQLAELVEQIDEAINEGEAYEVDGFGVFSAIGNNVIFIPSDELATEINYKYVGMEAIEMDDAVSTEQEPDVSDESDPFAGLLDDSDEESTPTSTGTEKTPHDESVSAPTEAHEGEKEDSAGESPFDLDDEEESEDIEEKPGPEKWGIDTYKDEGAETMFSGLLGDTPKEESKQEEDHFKAVFQQEDDDDVEHDTERIAEIERELSGKPGEDDQKDSEETEDQDEDPFATLAGVTTDDDDKKEDDLERALSSSLPDKEDDERDLEDALASSINEGDNSEEDEEPIPVIKNLASDKPKKKASDQEAPEKKEKKRQPFKRPKKTKEPGGQSAILLIVIIILVLGGGIYGLGYFGIVNIPGITPSSVPPTTQTTPPAPPTTMNEPAQEQTEEVQPAAPQENMAEDSEPTESGNIASEQDNDLQVTETQRPQEQETAGNASYGLTGTLSEAANDGYTIAVYSLTNEDNARAKTNELANDGYRVILAAIPHQRYGTLWRVSLGQFETMRDAAIAAQDLGKPFTDNYFITRIQ